MANDPDDPVDEREGTVLSPEELDITADQHVVELDEGRYLISAEDDARLPQGPIDDLDVGTPASSPDPAHGALDAEAVHGWLADRLQDADSRYGFDLTAVFEGQIVRQELLSDDVTATFENLLVWYAQHVGGDTPVEDVLGILLARSRAPIRVPPNAVRDIAGAYGLEGTDRLEDLFAAIDRDGGLRFRPDRSD